MGKPTGFLEYARREDAVIPVKERISSFKEFHTSLDPEKRKEQGARCMNCGVPMCQSAIKLKGMVTGCPLHNLIPEWNDEIYHDHIAHALSRLLKTSNFPEFTGRVCPALCEKACICGMNDDPVTIHNNELYLIESAFKQGLMKPRIPKIRSGKKVAVIGSGPSGLAVADQLNHRGHSVTVFEREDRIGGLLMYGIPNMKLQKEVIDRRRKLMEEEGVVFETGVNVGLTGKEASLKGKTTDPGAKGKNLSAQELLKDYDAIALCCGAKKARPLGVKDFDKVKGVYYAVDFLKSTTKSLLDSGLKEGTYISAKGKKVVIVGGGDTGNDCVGTCIRHGCKSVTQLEMMPAPPAVRRPDNPWPEWPKVLKTDYGQEEAITLFGDDPRIYETTVKELVTKNDKLTAIKTVKVQFKNGKLTEVEGSEKEIKCDLLLIAAGFTGCEEYTAKAFGTELTERGVVKTEAGSYRTGVPKVFSAGDMHRGQSLVVWAIAEGRECAREIDEYLMGYSNM
ncbi:MAG: glutamate synthase subunit beta [Butyrivibrio sp.]|nr:glutamate synthase subunit beta [Butyrivibrio sp.]